MTFVPNGAVKQALGRLALPALALLAVLAWSSGIVAAQYSPQPTPEYARLDVHQGLVPLVDGDWISKVVMGDTDRTQQVAAHAGEALPPISLTMPYQEGEWSLTLENEDGGVILELVGEQGSGAEAPYEGEVLAWHYDGEVLAVDPQRTQFAWTVGSAEVNLGILLETHAACHRCRVELEVDRDRDGLFTAGEIQQMTVSGDSLVLEGPAFVNVPPTSNYRVRVMEAEETIAVGAGEYDFIAGQPSGPVKHRMDIEKVKSFQVVFRIRPQARVMQYSPQVQAGVDLEITPVSGMVVRTLGSASVGDDQDRPEATPAPQEATGENRAGETGPRDGAADEPGGEVGEMGAHEAGDPDAAPNPGTPVPTAGPPAPIPAQEDRKRSGDGPEVGSEEGEVQAGAAGAPTTGTSLNEPGDAGQGSEATGPFGGRGPWMGAIIMGLLVGVIVVYASVRKAL